MGIGRAREGTYSAMNHGWCAALRSKVAVCSHPRRRLVLAISASAKSAPAWYSCSAAQTSCDGSATFSRSEHDEFQSLKYSFTREAISVFQHPHHFTQNAVIHESRIIARAGRDKSQGRADCGGSS